MRRIIKIILLIFIIIILMIFSLLYLFSKRSAGEDISVATIAEETITYTPTPEISEIKNNKKIFKPKFQSSKIISETSSMENSRDVDWWVNSGGQFIIGNGIASTITGDTPQENRWFNLYRNSNPQDTDGGLYPQNLFRLVTKQEWQNLDQILYFRIIGDNLSKSHNRNSSNGVLLFNRYHDGDNLYYVGLRVDGDVVVKKKIYGKYYTLAQSTLFPGDYNSQDNPNLIPKDTWIGIRSQIQNKGDFVNIKMLVDVKNNEDWSEKINIDDKSPGILINSGFAGIRTDFMDVEFKDYSIIELDN